MTYNKKTVEDVDVQGKKVLVRCDFNVPLDEEGRITDDKRIVASLPTIRYLLAHGAAVILCSHLGRPKGQVNPQYSLAPVAQRLTDLLGQPVALAADVVGPDAKAKAVALQPGQAMLLENVRYHAEEEKNDPAFAKELASLAQLYVNDAFGTAHRAHASTAGVADYLPAVAGFLIGKELAVMGQALSDPKRPFVAILGGAKVSDKIGVIENLTGKCDAILIGGAMANTFVRALGGSIGTSKCEEDQLDLARRLIFAALSRGCRLLLPADFVCAKEFSAEAEAKVCDAYAVDAGMMALDIGPRTAEQYAAAVQSAGTVVWNGPMGVFEFDKFAGGTRAVARAIAQSGAVSIIGGGDSAAAVEQLGYADQMTHISTGGGASLEFLEGRVLPGIACLEDR